MFMMVMVMIITITIIMDTEKTGAAERKLAIEKES